MLGTLTALASANALLVAFLYATRAPNVPPDTPSRTDLILLAVFGAVGLLAGIHMVRRFSTQDPPPAGETRLMAWLVLLVHASVLVAEMGGVVNGDEVGARAVAEVSAAWHAAGMMLAAALLVATSWTTARRKQRPGGATP